MKKKTPKTQKELNENKKETEAGNEKLRELSEEELNEVTGGVTRRQIVNSNDVTSAN